MSSIMPQNPWAVQPGLYVRVDGTVVQLSGQTQFWATKSANQQETQKKSSGKESAECHVEGNSGAGERDSEKDGVAAEDGKKTGL